VDEGHNPRSDLATNVQRTGRTSEERAYDAGVVAADIQSRLAAHDKHLADINGSVGDMNRELHKLRVGQNEIRSDLNTREQISKALAVVVREAAAKQVTTRSFFLGVAGLMLSLAALYLGSR
jgi:hypothetical protein